MPFIQLTGGAYTSRSLIAAAQRCLNLYPEATPQNQSEPFQVTHYCTPGLTFQGTAADNGCRGMYVTYSGDLYVCYGQHVFHYGSDGTWTQLGVLGPPSFPSDAAPRDTPVSMSDNGIIMLVVDGSKDGWFVDLTLPVASQTLNKIDLGINTGFLGADIVSYQDTFFILNSPGTAIYYISLSNINAASLTAAFSVQTVTLAPTGTGYSAGDVLTLTGTGGATITVNTVSSGTISTYSITTAGSTATQPSNPVATTGGTGTGATFNLTFLASGSNFILATAQAVLTGTAYTADDILTLPGTGGAQVTVNSVDASGDIVGYGVTNGGAVDVQPANPSSATGGTGNGATFVVTYQTNVGGFDPLDFAAMDAQANEMVAAVSVHRNLWLIGTNSYEIWINTGGDGTFAGSFPFQVYYPGAFANWGCCAKYSIAGIVNQLFWLSQDKFGHGMVMRADNLAAKRITTHAIEVAIAGYPTITDAIAYTYQQEGHNFYVISFPSANGDRGATWAYDDTTGEWHERCYIDSNGIEYMHLCVAAASAYGNVYAGDWRNGNIYTFDLNNYTDNGMPIKRVRSFPHQIDLQANRRVMYHQLIAQMEVGSSTASGSTQSVVDVDFDATDGTLLQNYHNINSLGANFTQITPTNAVIIADAVQAQVSGNVLYSVSGSPTTPDYSVAFEMKPTSYVSAAPSGDNVFVIGRATASNNGYQAAIVSDGTQYFVQLYVMPQGSVGGPGGPTASVALGTLTSGYYTVTMTMIGSGITVTVQRSQDSNYVNASGLWVGSTVNAISITDTTYDVGGQVLLGGNWDAAAAIRPPMTNPLPNGVSTGAVVGALGLSVTAQSGASITLSGVAATSADGIVTASVSAVAININLVGVGATSNTGTLAITANSTTSVSITLSGVVVTSAIGAPTPAISHEAVHVTLTGVSATTSLGNLTVTATAQVALLVHLTGVTATSGTGTISASLSGGTHGLTLTGVASTTAVTAPTISGNMAVQNGIYVLSGVVASQIAAAPVYWKVVEATSDGAGAIWPASTVTAMKAGGGKVLGYLDFGWCENYRPYYSPALAAKSGWTGPTAVGSGILGPLSSPEWPNEYEVQFWSTAWHTICTDWCAELQAAGFDGIYLDVVDAWGDPWPTANVPATGGFAAGTPQASAAAMIALINAIRTFAHSTNPNFIVFVNGGEELFSYSPPAYLNAIDGMYKEQVLYDGTKAENSANRLYEKGMLDNAKDAGKPVILIEYVSTAAQIADVKTTCASWGYGYYIANPNLDLDGVDQAGFGSTPPATPSPPAQAAAAGFNTLVFSDDFTSTSTVTLTNSGTPRPQFSWFPAAWGGNLTSTNVQVNTTWTAADANMQAQGVSPTSPTLANASAAGGIVKLQGGASNATLISVDGASLTLPTTGVWNTGYFEAYIQYRPGDLNATSSARGWPAFWAWTVTDLRGLGFGGSTFSGPYTEVDFWEYATIATGTWGGGAFHGSMSGGYSYTTPGVTIDNNWHTIGCRWTTTAVDFYYDNNHVGTTTAPSSTLAGGQQFIMLGCGLYITQPLAIPMFVDWVRVWQA
jgi:uncharacterized protein (TIGR01370 family)